MSNDVPWFAIDPGVEPAHTMRIPEGERIGVEAPTFGEAARVGWVEPDVMPAQRVEGGGPFTEAAHVGRFESDVMPAQRVEGGGPFTEAAHVGRFESDVMPAQRIEGGGPFTEAAHVGRFEPDVTPAFRVGTAVGEPMETARLKSSEGVPLHEAMPSMPAEMG
ncbi:hypothetical protein, partial [Kitasatospora sp. NPDC048407]|uniref:hypothetical protein n=1 Tax=Kitasatospora sp. NPDC048407 TaxID=3364051 RepID=UPI003723CA7D